MSAEDSEWLTPEQIARGARTSSRADNETWTPAKGLTKGCLACLVASAVLGSIWCYLAWHRPDVAVTYLHEDIQVTLVLATIGAMITFVFAWILFTVMHRASQFVSWPSALAVAVFVLMLVVAKQLVVAKHGVTLPDGPLQGAAWFAPMRFITSNVGAWIGLVGAVWIFREGDSLFDLFR